MITSYIYGLFMSLWLPLLHSLFVACSGWPVSFDAFHRFSSRRFAAESRRLILIGYCGSQYSLGLHVHTLAFQSNCCVNWRLIASEVLSSVLACCLTGQDSIHACILIAISLAGFVIVLTPITDETGALNSGALLVKQAFCHIDFLVETRGSDWTKAFHGNFHSCCQRSGDYQTTPAIGGTCIH